MSAENEFDEILKGKFDAAANSFPYSDDKWARMEEVIIADEARKKRRRFILIFMSGFMFAVLLILPLAWYYFSGNSRREENKSNNNLVKTKNIIKNKSVENIVYQSNNKKSIQKNVLTNENYTEQNPDNLSAFNLPKNRENFTKKPLPDMPSAGKLAGKTDGEYLASNVLSSEITDPKLNVQVVNGSNTNNTSDSENQLNKTDVAETVVPEDKQAVPAAAPAVGMDRQEVKDSILPSETDTVAKAVESTQSPEELAKSERDQSVAKGFHIGLNAGAGYHLGYQKTGELTDGKSFNPYTGIYVTYSSTQAWSLSTGINYTSVSGLSFQKQVVVRNFDFGYRDEVYELTQKRLHYVVVPLEFSKIWSGKNKIGIGAQLSYLCAAASEVTTYSQSSLGSESEAETQKTKAYIDGLNRFDIQPTVSYERIIKPRFTLRAESSIGLIDVRKSTWTNSGHKELNKNIRIIIKYQIK